MRYGSVCSGIEAASVAWHPLGWQAAWLAEIEPFPSAVLAHHYPQVPNLGDMTKIATRVLSGEVEAPDVLVGGTPCQAFSVAGMREGLDDPRGQLTIKYVELADAVDDVRSRAGKPPAIIVWENVPGVLSDKGNAFGCFLGALAGEDCALEPAGGKWTDAGCVYGPQRAIAWRVLDAQYFGLAQRRRRVFLVASARADFDPGAVLFELDSVRRDIAPSREAGQDTADTLASRTTGGGFPGTDEACSGYLQPVIMAHGQGGAEIRTDGGAPCLTCNHEAPIVVHGTQDPDTLRDMAHPLGRNQGQENAVCVTGQITHTLRAEGADASEDGTGRGTPIVTVAHVDCMPTLRSGGGTAAIHGAFSGDSKDEYIVPIAFDPNQITSPHNRSNPQPGAVCHTLPAKYEPPMLVYSSVRRLTPVECERLQGFPDGYTAIPWRGKAADVCPDGPRYKALGNSKAVPVVRWIGRRIEVALCAPC